MTESTIQNEIKVIESGTSGIWTYRKWSDGTAECWGIQRYDVTTSSYNFTLYFPTNLFISQPIINANGGITGEKYSRVNYVNGTASYLDIWVDAPSAANGVWLFAHVLGKWR